MKLQNYLKLSIAFFSNIKLLESFSEVQKAFNKQKVVDGAADTFCELVY